MARLQKAKGKVVRRLGVNIFGNPKYDRLLKKKPNGPGVDKNKRVRTKISDFGKQLIEKQKIRFAYGLSEKQFRGVYDKAKRLKGVTGDNMLILLERRLDNIVYRLGMAISRVQARQIVSHGHITVNGKKVNIPSYVVREGDVVSIRDKASTSKMIRQAITDNTTPLVSWLSLAEDDLKAEVLRLPHREDLPFYGDVQQVVEFYAK